MNWHIAGCLDSEADFISPDLDHCHNDIVIDDHTLIAFSGQDKHGGNHSQSQTSWNSYCVVSLDLSPSKLRKSFAVALKMLCGF